MCAKFKPCDWCSPTADLGICAKCGQVWDQLDHSKEKPMADEITRGSLDFYLTSVPTSTEFVSRYADQEQAKLDAALARIAELEAGLMDLKRCWDSNEWHYNFSEWFCMECNTTRSLELTRHVDALLEQTNDQ